MGIFEESCPQSVSQSANFKKFNEEVSIELFSQISNNEYETFSTTGVRMHNITNVIKIDYSGFLAQNGAEEIYAVIGYGSNDRWEDVEHLPMKKVGEKDFELITFRKKNGNINIAFKDSANNWDNNYGNNYIFQEQGRQGSH